MDVNTRYSATSDWQRSFSCLQLFRAFLTVSQSTLEVMQALRNRPKRCLPETLQTLSFEPNHRFSYLNAVTRWITRSGAKY
jgi:hypothetical protein